MKVSKEMPEEVKNQIIDGKKRVVTVPLPKKITEALAKKLDQKGKLIQKFFQISMSVVKGQRAMMDISKQLEDIETSINGRMKDGFKKLRLDKQKDRQWRFDGRSNFIGVYNPPKKVAPKK